MVERTEDRLDLKPEWIAADIAYGTGEMIGWAGRAQDRSAYPVWDRSEAAAEGTFVRADFIYDKARDVYVCPNGKELRTSGMVHDGMTIQYIAKKSGTAPNVRSSTTAPQARSVRSRDVNEAARDYVRSLMKTEAYRQSARQRKRSRRGSAMRSGIWGSRVSDYEA